MIYLLLGLIELIQYALLQLIYLFGTYEPCIFAPGGLYLLVTALYAITGDTYIDILYGNRVLVRSSVYLVLQFVNQGA